MNKTSALPNGSARANRPKKLLIFDTIADESFTGTNTAFVDYVLNPKNGMCTLKLDMGSGIRYWSRTTADESAIRDAICGLLDKADWLPAQTACHDVTNEAPAILSRSSVEQIIAHTLKDARPEDNALSVAELMALRYTEA